MAARVQLLDAAGGWLTLGAAHHRDPRDRRSSSEDLRARPERCAPGDGGARAGRSEPVVVPDVDEDELRAILSPQFHALHRRLWHQLAIAIPLRAEGRCSARSPSPAIAARKPYSEDDVLLANELAYRAATAIRHARNADALKPVAVHLSAAR